MTTRRKPVPPIAPSPGSRRSQKADLDALQVFDAVMAEQNMTRAAIRLAMTPSAVSHAISRLKATVKDELFTRTASGVRPTRRAVELWDSIGGAVRTLQGAVGRGSFDPAASRFEVRLSLNDMFAELLGPGLYSLFTGSAPNASVNFRQRRQIEDESRLQAGSLDFAVGTAFTRSPNLEYLQFWQSHYRFVFREHHPAADALRSDPDEVSVWPHLYVMPDGETAAVDQALADLGYRPRRRSAVGTFSCVPAIVSTSDCIALLPSTYVHYMRARYPGLSQCPGPVALPPLPYFLAWHERSERIREKAWALGALKDFLLSPAVQAILDP